ncbi:hypothetical protein KO317_02775 [Candidatus Micrarchaeota archaeon]|nr:hypothetical protein [Candidatus Micrarchaeota archaeon]
MKSKTNGSIVYEDISDAVSFRRWWHGVVYLLSFLSIFYYLITFYSNFLDPVNISIFFIFSILASFLALFLITLFLLIIVFLLEKLLSFLNIQIIRPSLKLFLSYFKKNYGFTYSDYLKYLIVKTERTLEEPLNKGVYLDEVKKSVKDLKLEFFKIKNSLIDANMQDLNPSLMEEINSLLFSLDEILKLKTITLENKTEILEFLNKLEKTIFSEDFGGLKKIELRFGEVYKTSYLDKVDLLFKLMPKKYFYGLIFYIIFIIINQHLHTFYRINLLNLYVLIVILILCYIKKE